MKLISITTVLLLLALTTFCQSPPPPPAGPGGSDNVTLNGTPAPLTQMLVFPMTFCNSQVNIVVQNPPTGTYILELVEPPTKVLKTKVVTGNSNVLYDLQNINTDDVLPGNYVVRYNSGGNLIVGNVTIVAP